MGSWLVGVQCNFNLLNYNWNLYDKDRIAKWLVNFSINFFLRCKDSNLKVKKNFWLEIDNTIDPRHVATQHSKGWQLVVWYFQHYVDGTLENFNLLKREMKISFNCMNYLCSPLKISLTYTWCPLAYHVSENFVEIENRLFLLQVAFFIPFHFMLSVHSFINI